MAYDFEAMENIKRLKYSYCRGIDSCDLALLERVFTEDAEIDYHGGTYRFNAVGRDQILAAIKGSFHKDFVACHTVHMPIIDVLGDGTANGQWRLLDYAMNLRESNMVTIGAAEYVDRYVHLDGHWRIKRSAYTRVYERVYHEADHALTAHMLAQRAPE